MYLSVSMMRTTKPGSEIHEWHKTRFEHLKELFVEGGEER